MIKKTIKRLFLNFIFNKFNTYPKYLSTFMPTEFKIKKIHIPLIQKFLLKFYKNEREELYKNNTSFSLLSKISTSAVGVLPFIQLGSGLTEVSILNATS